MPNLDEMHAKTSTSRPIDISLSEDEYFNYHSRSLLAPYHLKGKFAVTYVKVSCIGKAFTTTVEPTMLALVGP